MDLEQSQSLGELMGALGSRTFLRKQYTSRCLGVGVPSTAAASRADWSPPLREPEGSRAGLDKSGCPKLGFQGVRTLFSSHLGQLTCTDGESEAHNTV